MNGLISSGTVKKKNITGFDTDPAKCAAARKRYSIPVSASIPELVACCDIILFAVKPQNIGEVFKELPSRAEGKLYISIAAGVTTSGIERALGRLGRPRVVRVMPNTPALVGEGISAVCKGRYATLKDLKTAGEIFSSVGEAVNIGEKYFDIVTAVSGSGPAYFFYLKEALIEAAVSLGLDRTTAKRLVSKTALGAAKLLVESGHEPETLRQRVTSKGGTTEQAIRVFESSGIKKVIARAVAAAAEHSKKLSGK